MRVVEVFRHGVWTRVEMKDVKSGEKFLMFEADGGPVYGEGPFAGETEFTADCDAYALGNGRFGVNGRQG